MSSPVIESTSETRKHHRHAWLVPSAAVTTAETFGPNLIHAGWHPGVVIALGFHLGVLGGVAWQVLNRRDFVDRFVGFALLLLAVMLLLVFGSWSAVTSGAELSFPGVIAGVVLTEAWMRRRHNAQWETLPSHAEADGPSAS